MSSEISQEAVDLIVAEEVSSPAAYEKKYRHPEWPGASSGVTIGCGYDVGQNSEAEFRKDWTGVIPDAMVDALAATCGIVGSEAAPHARALRDVVDVPWAAATKVFEENTLPRYIALARKYLPNTEKLSPDSFGAIVSLVFNRGASFNNSGPRYAEMRAIKAHMAEGHFDAIPDEFRAMKRLWPDLAGLRNRRDHEAALFEKGLAAPPVAAPLHEQQGSGFDPGAAGHELQGRAPAPAPERATPPTVHHTLAEQVADAFWRLFGWKK